MFHVKRPQDNSLLRALRGKSIDELRQRIGRDWLSVSSYIKRTDPRTDVLVKTISIRNDSNGCFIVVRGRYGASDVVMMRQAGDFDHAISFIAYMIHKGTWKPDRYGVDGNALLADRLSANSQDLALTKSSNEM